MQYRTDTKTGNELSILGFGCMRFPRSRGGRIDFNKSEEMVVDAVNRGVNYFDTAYIYPGSEDVTGRIIAQNNLRDKIYLATKLPLFLCKSYADFDKYLNKSLERLKTDRIDYYLMHMITTPEQWKALCSMGIEKWIDEKQAEGKIKQLGFSFHGKRDDFIGIIDAREWDFTMIQYNYLDINNQAGRAGLLHANAKNIPVFVMEPLLGGRLANPKTIPEKVYKIMKESSPALTPAARALRWIWNHKEVTLLLSGMSATNQLNENIIAASEMTAPDILSSAELATVERIIAAFNEANKIPCTGCGYCMPCPRGVNIVDSFSAYNVSYAAGLLYAMKTYVQATGALATAKGLASRCNGCGSCAPICPQNINVAESLKAVKKRLEPFWFTPIVSAARFFTGVRAKK